MANFGPAFDKTMAFEGGYSADPVDVGGETYKGIARHYHTEWLGWKILDSLKHTAGFPKVLDTNPDIQRLTREFYKRVFWDQVRGDQIPDQNIAEEVFDTAVNMGIKRSVAFLQRSLNLMNRNGELFADIPVDGACGDMTIRTLTLYLSRDKAEYIFKLLNILRGMHYIEFMTANPVQERFARGWLGRVEFLKS